MGGRDYGLWLLVGVSLVVFAWVALSRIVMVWRDRPVVMYDEYCGHWRSARLILKQRPYGRCRHRRPRTVVHWD